MYQPHGTTITTPTETADTTTTNDLGPVLGYTPKATQDSEIAPTSHKGGSHECSARAEEDYPESEVDDWEWDDLEHGIHDVATNLVTVDITAIVDTTFTPDHLPRKRQDPEELKHESNQDNSAGSKQVYPESEIDEWDWDELEASPSTGTTTSIQPQKQSSPLKSNDGTTRGPTCADYLNHAAETLNTICQPPPGSILEKIALIPRQSFPEMGQITIGILVTMYTGGDAQIWKVCHIRPGIGTSITLKYENCETTVDMSWLTFDINVGTLELQRLGFFKDSMLKRTTNSIEIWRNILNPDKMIDGETLMVLLEWTIHGSPSNDTLGLPKAQSKTWLVDRSFWQSWEQMNPNRCPG